MLAAWLLLLPPPGREPGTQNRSRIQLRDHDGSGFFSPSGAGQTLAMASQRPEPTWSVPAALDGQRNGQGFATLGATKAARIFGESTLTGGMGFSFRCSGQGKPGYASRSCRPADCCCCVGAPPRRLMGTRRERSGNSWMDARTHTRTGHGPAGRMLAQPRTTRASSARQAAPGFRRVQVQPRQGADRDAARAGSAGKSRRLNSQAARQRMS